MKYRALRDGYLERYIHAGETFDWNGKKPSWAESLGPAVKCEKQEKIPAKTPTNTEKK